MHRTLAGYTRETGNYQNYRYCFNVSSNIYATHQKKTANNFDSKFFVFILINRKQFHLHQNTCMVHTTSANRLIVYKFSIGFENQITKRETFSVNSINKYGKTVFKLNGSSSTNLKVQLVCCCCQLLFFPASLSS